MSVSIYYKARREQPVTPQEISFCKKIVEQYNTSYPFGELYEGFCVYDLKSFRDESEKDVIFSGATKLPTVDEDDIDILLSIVNYWVKCLDEITEALPGAAWKVNLDDIEMIWDEENGWGFPADDVKENRCNPL